MNLKNIWVLENNHTHTLSAKVLGQLSLMQSVVNGLPNEKSVFQFIQRGFQDIPGIQSVEIFTESFDVSNPDNKKNIIIKKGKTIYGIIQFVVSDNDLFSRYIPYIENFAAMLSVIFEEKRQKIINTALLDELKHKKNELETKNIELHDKNIETQQLNEELTASNEELITTNEELMATNEELAYKNNLLDRKSIELEKALKELKETQVQLIQSEKMASVGIMISGIAHELNNPLNFITGGLYAIEEKKQDLTDDTKSLFDNELGFIQEGVNRSVKIINALNNFSKEDKIGYSLLDVHESLNNCIDIVSYSSDKKIDFQKEYFARTTQIKGNDSKIHMLFMNILTNSTQAICNEGVISVNTKSDENAIIITIKDNGHGISQNNIKSVFDPFFTTKEPGIGTGLGLSIAYNIVKEHKGTISIESECGKSTTVNLWLPFAQ